MTIARFSRHSKRPFGICVKMSMVAILGLCFIFLWSFFSSPSSSVSVQLRESFDDIAEPVSAKTKPTNHTALTKPEIESSKQDNQEKVEISKRKEEKIVDGSGSGSGSGSFSVSHHESRKKKDNKVSNGRRDKPSIGHQIAKEKQEQPESESDSKSENESGGSENEEEEGEVVDGKEEASEGEGEVNEDIERDGDSAESVNQEADEKAEEENDGVKSKGKKRKIKGPVFDPKAHYSWKLCSSRSKQNYIPCIDIESGFGRLQGYRHKERSCPKTSPMCLVPLPHDGYGSSVPWPDSKLKVVHKNVAHPKLAAFVKKHNWLVDSGEYLTFPQNQTRFKGGVVQYLESIEETVPDIEWGKNIRVVLDIGCTDSSFVAALLEKDVLTLSLGLKDDLVDLAQVALERGFPTVVSPFASRRLPFPSGVFDAIHCGGCSIAWHSNGGKLLLEMNRILRPGGYFILSTKHDSIEDEEVMIALIASLCWNILAHKTDEANEMGVKIYQKPTSNDIYELRRKKNPPLCKENENPDASWYVPMKNCLHTIPSSIEEHGTDWPEEWPKRLETYPEWLTNKEKLIADTNHWKSIVDKSYLSGMGIDWSNVRNIMDMTAIYGGFAAALLQQKVWVMNVVPVHAPDTLPFIYERGLIGVYHDWCESFGTYPRSYDLIHADHLFTRLKQRCKQPASIVVEMDRIVRPGGWVIVRDKVEILDSLEGILRSLHWEIRMTYAQNKEGILCAQKTLWRP